MPEEFTKINRIDGWLSKREGQMLYKLAFELALKGAMVEIGSYLGKSTIYMAMAVKKAGGGEIYAIDPHLGQTHVGKKDHPETWKRFLANLKVFGAEKVVTPIRKTSRAASVGWRKPIALLHIDGLHEYEFAKEDLKLWLPHLMTGGAVVCHDAFAPFPHVFRAVREEVIDSNKFRKIWMCDSQIVAVKGKAKGMVERINLWRSKVFITLAMSIWHGKMSPVFADFLVKRVLKIFYFNRNLLKF